MRALLVVVGMGALLWSWLLPAQAELVTPRAGESVTQSDLLGYLFAPPQAGDWLRYRVWVNGNLLLVKTIGFGEAKLSDQPSAFFEIQTHTVGLSGAPSTSQSVAGGDIIWKMFVNASNFNDPSRQYSFVAGILKIGESAFRIGGNPLQPATASLRQSLSSMLLFGLLPIQGDRSGTVASSMPEDVRVHGVTLHTVHTTVDFPANDLGMVAGLAAQRMELWQTSDVPMGLVNVKVASGQGVFWIDLVSFGHGDYRDLITEDINSVPYFPGS